MTGSMMDVENSDFFGKQLVEYQMRIKMDSHEATKITKGNKPSNSQTLRDFVPSCENEIGGFFANNLIIGDDPLVLKALESGGRS